MALTLKFSGIDNLHDPADLSDGAVVAARNGVFSDKGTFIRRAGRTRVYSGSTHSIYNSLGQVLFVEGGILKALAKSGSTFTANTLLTLSSNDPVCYATGGNGVTVFSNGIDIGFVISNVANFASAPAETRTVDGIDVPTFLEELPAGVALAAWNGVLLIASAIGDETWLFHTNPYDWSGIDSRGNYQRFKGQPTILGAVDDGYYIGAGESVYYSDLKQMKLVISGAAVKGSLLQLDAMANTGIDGASGKAVMFVANGSVYLGLNSGQVVNMSKSVAIAPASAGAAYFSDNNGINSAVFVLSEEEFNNGMYQHEQWQFHEGRFGSIFAT